MNALDEMNDKETFSSLIQSIENDLYNIAKHKISNENDIEDIIQETILKIYKNYDSLKKEENFKAWSIKILLNECNNFYKRNYKERLLFNKIVCKKSVNLEDNSILEFEDELCFKELLKGLSQKDQDIFICYYQCNYSIKDIADILNINENTIKSTLKRSKIKLKKMIKGGRHDDEK